MEITCSVCGYEYEGDRPEKCPRCGSAPRIMSGCENCSGCSFWKSCGINNTDSVRQRKKKER